MGLWRRRGLPAVTRCRRPYCLGSLDNEGVCLLCGRGLEGPRPLEKPAMRIHGSVQEYAGQKGKSDLHQRDGKRRGWHK